MDYAGFADSWYEASTRRPAPQPALAGTVDTDVCVIGGGIAGCSTALHLAQRGCGQAKLERLLGPADARRIWDVSVEGLRLQRALIATHAIDCDYVAGQMHVALKPRQERELREELETLATRYGYAEARMVEREELRDLVASGRYVSGTLDTGGGHLHPLKYTLGLAQAAQRAGARIFEGSRALGWDRRDGRLVVRTAGGTVRCRTLALCGNAWLGPSAPRLDRRIMGVGTYIVATETLGAERAAGLIRNDAAISDVNWVLDYFRRSSDHRLLFGGRVSYSGVDPFTAAATRARMLRVFPQLADVRVEYAWGGLVDITMNRAPDFGRLEPDVYYLQGFSGHGIALTGIAGRLLADAIAGESERFDVFGRIPHRPFPGGPALRRPALTLAMLWYRLRDLL
jgi:gamma-glutamylputrescine oxidase